MIAFDYDERHWTYLNIHFCKWLDRLDLIGFDRVLLAIHFRLKCGCVFDCQDCKGLAMARSSKLITLCVALVAFVALRSVAFLGAPGPQAQLRGTPLEIAAGAAVPAVLMTPTAAMAADGGMPSVVLGVGILCMLAAFSAVSSVISATVTSELDWVSWKIRPFSSSEAGRCRKVLAPSLHPLVNQPCPDSLNIYRRWSHKMSLKQVCVSSQKWQVGLPVGL